MIMPSVKYILYSVGVVSLTQFAVLHNLGFWEGGLFQNQSSQSSRLDIIKSSVKCHEYIP